MISPPLYPYRREHHWSRRFFPPNSAVIHSLTPSVTYTPKHSSLDHSRTAQANSPTHPPPFLHMPQYTSQPQSTFLRLALATTISVTPRPPWVAASPSPRTPLSYTHHTHSFSLHILPLAHSRTAYAHHYLTFSMDTIHHLNYPPHSLHTHARARERTHTLIPCNGRHL